MGLQILCSSCPKLILDKGVNQDYCKVFYHSTVCSIASHRVQVGFVKSHILSCLKMTIQLSLYTLLKALPAGMMQEWITLTELSQKRPELKGVKHMKAMNDGSHIPESTIISVRDLQTLLYRFVLRPRRINRLAYPFSSFSVIFSSSAYVAKFGKTLHCSWARNRFRSQSEYIWNYQYNNFRCRNINENISRFKLSQLTASLISLPIWWQQNVINITIFILRWKIYLCNKRSKETHLQLILSYYSFRKRTKRYL